MLDSSPRPLPLLTWVLGVDVRRSSSRTWETTENRTLSVVIDMIRHHPD